MGTAIPVISTVTATLAQMELEITRERITDSATQRRALGRNPGGWRQTFTDSQSRNAPDCSKASSGYNYDWHPFALHMARLAAVCAAVGVPIRSVWW
jgi:hypothetical protein